jgi:hypothetical protein
MDGGRRFAADPQFSMDFMIRDIFRRKVVFKTNAELFEAVGDLIAQLRTVGQVRAAEELEVGMRCLNGLTDGWALFLESIDKVRAMASVGLTVSQKAALADIRAAVHRLVYRR